MPILRSRDPNSTKQNKDLGKTRNDQVHLFLSPCILRSDHEHS